MSSLPPPDPVFLATATEIVLRAGDIQLRGQESGFRIDKKGTIDLVTEIDLECERMCRAVIGERFPDHAILAEELGGPGADAVGARYRWIFDPLDGTTNYAHGLPIYCASLGLEIDGTRAVAAIYDPSRRELFTAERGQGAYLNGGALHVSPTPALIDSVLVTGFPYDMDRQGPELIDLFGRFMRRARAVRRLGSAALDLCYVAAGRFDAFWEQHLKPWDVAAGVLVVEEAGGHVTGMNGAPFDVAAGHLLASNGLIHGQMLEVIATFGKRDVAIPRIQKTEYRRQNSVRTYSSRCSVRGQDSFCLLSSVFCILNCASSFIGLRPADRARRRLLRTRVSSPRQSEGPA